jgi:hypothetical protein
MIGQLVPLGSGLLKYVLQLTLWKMGHVTLSRFDRVWLQTDSLIGLSTVALNTVAGTVPYY